MRGDINNSGKIDALDSLLALRAYVNTFIGLDPNLSEPARTATDVDQDGRITLTDAQFILRYYVYNTILKYNISWDMMFLAAKLKLL